MDLTLARVISLLRWLLHGKCNIRRQRWIDPTGLSRDIAQPVGYVSCMDLARVDRWFEQ